MFTVDEEFHTFPNRARRVDCKAKRWWLLWGGIEHREDDPGCAITLQFKDGRHEPGMRAIRKILAGETYSVNFHHVPKELLEKCPTFASIAAARLAGVGLSATDEVMKSGVRAEVNGEVVSQMCVEDK
ncbi:hypothetical protein AAVH_31437 [Aphelenchoides avenae]|nr:hypothetical protein AAVH_31437 [Aphelenchus avenae]